VHCCEGANAILHFIFLKVEIRDAKQLSVDGCSVTIGPGGVGMTRISEEPGAVEVAGPLLRRLSKQLRDAYQPVVAP